MTKSSKPSSVSTTTQSSSPWSGQQPYLKDLWKQGQEHILNNPAKPYPNSTVVGFSNQTKDALQGAEDRARSGSSLQTGAKSVIQDTLDGKYMNSNSHLDKAVEAATAPMVRNYKENIQPGIDSSFSGSGRYGSGAMLRSKVNAADDLNRQVGNVAGSVAYQNYNSGMSNMMKAAEYAPQLARTDYDDIGKLQDVGNIREGQAGAELQDDINRFNHGQHAKDDAIQKFAALMGGSYGGSTTSNQPIYNDRVGTGLGYAATAAGLAGSLFGNGGLF